MPRTRIQAVGMIVAFAVACLGAAEARANPEKVFKGQIITSAKDIPTSHKSASAYVSALKKLRTKRFFENKKKKSWTVHYAAFFKKPLNDLELTIRLYDVTEGGKDLLTSFEQYLDTRGLRSFISDIDLDRETVGVNKNVLMVVENRGVVLASATFQLLGEAEKYTGEVNFSDEETRGDKD